MSEKKLKEFNDKYGEKIRLLKSIGIMPFGFDPGFLVMVNDQSVDLPLKLVDIICGLIKKVNSHDRLVEIADKLLIHTLNGICSCDKTGQEAIRHDEDCLVKICDIDKLEQALKEAENG